MSLSTRPPTVESLARLRLGVGCALTIVSLAGLIGADWDIQWHATVGRDRTFTPPHDLILTSIGLSGILALANILVESWWTRGQPGLQAHTTAYLGVLRSALGSYLVGFGAVCSAIAFPLDTYWHSLYGIDVSLWAPFHVMIFMGSVLGTFGIVYLLLSAAHLAAMDGDRRTAMFSYAALVACLGILLSKLSTLLTPSIAGHHVDVASLNVSLFPLLMAVTGAFVCVLAARLVPWPGGATAVTAVFLLLMLLVRAVVPPMIGLLVQVEHETYLARAARLGSTVIPLLGQTPLLLLAALSVDGVTWIGRRRRWTVTRRNARVALAATLGMLLVAGLSLLQLRVHAPLARAGGARGGLLLSLLLTIPGGLLGNNWSLLVVHEPRGHLAGTLRRAIQLLLCVSAAAALAVTAVTFYQVVLAATIHGAPARFVDATAGPYHVKLALYDRSIQAGAIIPFDLAVAPGTPGPLTYQVTASPGPLIVGSQAQGDVDPRQPTPYGVPGSITLVTRGAWTLHVTVQGPAGHGQADIPLTAVTFPAMPAWLAWNVGLIPLYGLLLFWLVQIRGERSSIEGAPTMQPAHRAG